MDKHRTASGGQEPRLQHLCPFTEVTAAEAEPDPVKHKTHSRDYFGPNLRLMLMKHGCSLPALGNTQTAGLDGTKRNIRDSNPLGNPGCVASREPQSHKCYPE